MTTPTKHIQLIAFDIDGVFTAGGIGWDSDHVETKTFDVQDGAGLVGLRKADVHIAIITGRESTIVSKRASELGIIEVHQGVKDKLAVLRDLQERLDVSPTHTAFMGDDLPDLVTKDTIGCFITPANGHQTVKLQADWITKRGGGQGAIREVCDHIMWAKKNVTGARSNA